MNLKSISLYWKDSKEYLLGRNDRNGTTYVENGSRYEIFTVRNTKCTYKLSSFAANDNITGNDDAICVDKK